MNIVIWARVSSREQREGYSIDAQLRLSRLRAQEQGWQVVREFVVAESAKRGAERLAFQEMFAWVKAHAKREKIQAILSHKLDRVCRNMRDAVRLQELEDTCGVRLAFVENQFGPGAAGALSFNVMAAVAQYYSDNLRTEVLKGMDEKVRQGWPTGLAPFGYCNTRDREEPIQPHPEKSRTLLRMFELYASGGHTFQTLADQLAREGHTFRPSQPRFNRTALSYILGNRFYLGELHRHGHVYPGRYQRIIDRTTFEACQEILQGRNRRRSSPVHPLAGGLFRCQFCGQGMTGERIRRAISGGEVREHLYYRCANNHPGPDHPRVRWKSADLESAILDDLARLRFNSAEIATWFRNTLATAVTDLTASQRRQATALAKRKTELANMQERLLNVYLSGTIEEAVYRDKSQQLKAELARNADDLSRCEQFDESRGELALRLFDWTQRLPEIWRRSNNAQRREILQAIYLNRAVSDVSLVAVMRKPFDVLAEGLEIKNSRSDRI
ncbi:MAG: recombinase family protein [Pirellulales bacterium]|nr:recombinase family protein [Pirellulales bacterium]